MLKHMDFILGENEERKKKLRFYPRHSSLHLFDEGLKKAGSERTFKDVYKIYYCWAILLSENDYSYETDGHGELIKNEDGSYKTISNWTPYKQVFGFSCDECSSLSAIGDLTRHVIAKRESIDDYMTFGQPGSDWNIRYNKGYTHDEYLKEWYRNDGYNVQNWEDWEKEVFGLVSEQEFYKREGGRHPYLQYMVWNGHIGFKFNLDVNRAYEFADYIDQVNHYMLEHGVPICLNFLNNTP